MANLDITRTNQAIEQLLKVTENPRHRFLLQAFHRHRYLEIAGRYEEIFAPEMMVEQPVYHFHDAGSTRSWRDRRRSRACTGCGRRPTSASST